MTGAPMQYTSKGCKNDNFQMSLLMFLGYRQNSSALWNITEYVGGGAWFYQLPDPSVCGF